MATSAHGTLSTTSPSGRLNNRTPLVASLVAGVAIASFLTYLSFWGLINDSPEDNPWITFLFCLPFNIVAAAVSYRVVISGMRAGTPAARAKRAVALAGLALVTFLVFWMGTPVVFAAAAIYLCLRLFPEVSGGPRKWTIASVVSAALAAVATVLLIVLDGG